MSQSYIRQEALYLASRVVQSEDVVEHVVRGSIGNQVEHLRVTLGVLLFVDKQLAGHHDQNVALGRGGLGVQSGDSVGHLSKWQTGQLLHNVLGALQLRGLEGQHGLLSVQVAQLGSVVVELLVVEVAEFGGYGVEIDCVLVEGCFSKIDGDLWIGTGIQLLGQLGPKAAYIPDMAVVLIDGSGNFFTPSDVVGAACRTLIIGSNGVPLIRPMLCFFF